MLRVSRPLEEAGVEVIHGSDTGVVWPETIQQADAILIQREFPEHAGNGYERIVQQAREASKPIIYEIDDLLLDIPPDHPDYASHSYTAALIPMLCAILEADLVTTSSQPLQAYYQILNPNTLLLPNYLDDAIWQPREISLQSPSPPKIDSTRAETTPVVVGYMGSNTHQPDLELISPVLENLLGEYAEKIILKFWGVTPPERLRQRSNVLWTPLEINNYRQFAQYFSQQECDIFIAPLVENSFNACKSPIKFFEYSILGIPGVYSRVSPYQAVVHNGSNGFLAGDLAEWQAALTTMIENSELRFQIGQAAQNTVLKHWLLSNHAEEWSKAYQLSIERSHAGVIKTTNDERLAIVMRVAVRVQSWLEILRQNQANQKPADDSQATALDARALQIAQDELARVQQHMNEIHQSETWRLINAMNRLKRLLYPTGSSRERALQNLAHRFSRSRLHPPE